MKRRTMRDLEDFESGTARSNSRSLPKANGEDCPTYDILGTLYRHYLIITHLSDFDFQNHEFSTFEM